MTNFVDHFNLVTSGNNFTDTDFETILIFGTKIAFNIYEYFAIPCVFGDVLHVAFV